ncbi:MAG TPA: M23 family metallopeptidase [Trichocoleus sp.]
MGKRFLALRTFPLSAPLGVLLGLAALPLGVQAATSAAPVAIAQAVESDSAPGAASDQRTAACPPSAISRFTRHRVQSGETVETIAEQYRLQPPTLLRLNPNLSNSLSVGQEIVVPPFNGIVVTVPQGQTWEQVATRYQSRSDVLFEVNGCQAAVPERVFVPGLNWLTGGTATASSSGTASLSNNPLRGYPLPAAASILAAYGWQTDPAQGKLIFNTGVTLAAAPTTTVLAAGDGVVAFAGEDNVYGNLVVINHQQGLQTRYANLSSVAVTAGQTVRQGASIGTIAPYGEAPESFLFFEVRLNSDLGWVAQDPQNYIPSLAVR